MNAQAPISIVAEVSDAEQRGVKAGVEFLARSLRAARPEGPPQARLGFCPQGYDVSLGPRIDIYISSMLPELSRPSEPRHAILARWTRRIQTLQEHVGQVFLCTIFRHVADRARDGRPDATLTRIRDLNLLIADLSQAHGANVIDIDCAMAGFGARHLGTDHKLGGQAATVVAGHTVATAILSANLDDVMEAALQQAALRALGGTAKLGKAIFNEPARQPARG